jgi:photosystem II stability/assembly factor-like uncharacterized protein
MAVDSSGNAYLSGWSGSPDLPIVNGFQTSLVSRPPGEFVDPSSFASAFVIKLDSSGSRITYSTYLGGIDRDAGNAIAVEEPGIVYVAGGTGSEDFPTKNSFQSHYSQHRREFKDERPASSPNPPGFDAFLAKLDTSKSGSESLLYSTYIGGNGRDSISGIALGATGKVYVTGDTNSFNFPVKAPLQSALKSLIPKGYNAFLAGIDTSRAGDDSLFYSTYLGGSSNDYGVGVKTDSAGNIYLMGHSISPDFPLSNAIFAHAPLLKSLDSGTILQSQASGMTISEANLIEIDPQNPSVIYAGNAEPFAAAELKGLFKSSDNGGTWKKIEDQNLLLFSSLAIDPVTPTTLYAGTFSGNSITQPGIWAGRVLKSIDGGNNWFPTELQIIGQDILDLAVDPQSPNIVYAAAGSRGEGKGGVYKTSNGGASWELMNKGMTEADVTVLVLDPSTPSTIYAGTENGLFKSNDRGNNWNPTVVEAYIIDLEIDPKNTSNLYASIASDGQSIVFVRRPSDGRGNPRKRTGQATERNPHLSKGVIRSADGGTTWSEINIGLESDGRSPFGRIIHSVKIDPNNPLTLYAGTDTGLYKSTNRGDSWSFTGQIDMDAKVIAVSRQEMSPLYVGGTFRMCSYVVKLKPDGIIYSTYLTPTSGHLTAAFDVGENGDLYIVGADQVGNGVRLMRQFIEKISETGRPRARIADVVTKGQNLIITGENFSEGAVVLINGSEQNTRRDAKRPATRLVAKKSARQIKLTEPVIVQVRNSNGSLSNEYRFIRQ